MLYKKILILSVILTSLGLFHIRGLGIMVRLFDILSVALIISFLILFIFFGKQEIQMRKSFTFPLILMLVGVLLSTLPSYYLHNQPIGITLYQQRYMYAFLFYFVLFYLSPKPDYIISILYYLAVFAGIFFILQYILYPTLITDAKVFTQRGTIRMNLPGTYLMHIGFILSMDRFLTNYKVRYGLAALLLLTVAVLSGFRSTLAIYLLISTGILIFRKDVRNKILMFSLYFLFIVAVFFSFQSIIVEMRTSAEKESAEGTSNIRYRASEFFVKKSIEDKMSQYLGNGVPSERSSYGKKLALISLRSGYYLSDIGIVGFYFKFGLLSSLMLLFILFKIIFTKLPPETQFIRYFFLFQLLIIFNTTLSFDSLPDIVLVCLLFYLVDRSRYEVKEVTGNKIEG